MKLDYVFMEKKVSSRSKSTLKGLPLYFAFSLPEVVDLIPSRVYA